MTANHVGGDRLHIQENNDPAPVYSAPFAVRSTILATLGQPSGQRMAFSRDSILGSGILIQAAKAVPYLAFLTSLVGFTGGNGQVAGALRFAQVNAAFANSVISRFRQLTGPIFKNAPWPAFGACMNFQPLPFAASA